MRPAERVGVGLRPAGRGRSHRGFTLVVVLVLLTAVAWGTAASLRGSAGSTRIGRVQMMQAHAMEQAQLALTYCQLQLLLPSSARRPELAEAALPLTTPQQPAWSSASLWRTPGSVLTVPLEPVQSVGVLPQCFVEQQTLTDQPRGLPVQVLTARGFSPDYRADPTSGNTAAGQAVWLQRVLLIEGGQLRAQTERRLLNPPVR